MPLFKQEKISYPGHCYLGAKRVHIDCEKLKYMNLFHGNNGIISWPIPWLLMPWILVSSGHQPPWYKLCRINLLLLRGICLECFPCFPLYYSQCCEIINIYKLFIQINRFHNGYDLHIYGILLQLQTFNQIDHTLPTTNHQRHHYVKTTLRRRFDVITTLFG